MKRGHCHMHREGQNTMNHEAENSSQVKSYLKSGITVLVSLLGIFSFLYKWRSNATEECIVTTHYNSAMQQKVVIFTIIMAKKECWLSSNLVVDLHEVTVITIHGQMM